MFGTWYRATMKLEIVEGKDILGRLTIAARLEDQTIGYLTLDPRPGLDGLLVRHIQVEPNYRRMGIATKLWQTAKEWGYNPVHAIDKTELGESWAKAVGD